MPTCLHTNSTVAITYNYQLQRYLIVHLQALEEKVAKLTATGSVIEPILTCVQCQEEYKESQNIKGCCKYHPYYMEIQEPDFYREDDMYVNCALYFNTY